MSNLLSIEQAFLSLPQVKQALNLQEIRAVQRTITNAKKKKFEQTLTLSKLVGSVVQWFGSEDGQRLCAEEGISWTNEQIGLKVFGWQKSFFYKVVKASKLKDEVVDTFKAKCDELEAQGEEPNRSLEGLLKFAKQVENAPEGGGQGEGGEGEGEGEENAPQVETRSQVVLSLSYKVDGQSLSVKVDTEGRVKITGGESSAVVDAIEFLYRSINNQNSQNNQL
jgi:hypothetical protein